MGTSAGKKKTKQEPKQEQPNPLMQVASVLSFNIPKTPNAIMLQSGCNAGLVFTALQELRVRGYARDIFIETGLPRSGMAAWIRN
jgi:hypothetical protein